MKGIKLYAVFVALAFVLCAFLFSPPTLFAGQLPVTQKQSVTPAVDVMQASAAFVDLNSAFPTTSDEINFRVTEQYLPPVARKTLPKANGYKGLNRQRPEQPPNRI